MNKIDIYAIKFSDDKMLICIGSEENIRNLKESDFNHDKKKLVNYIIENEIYCNLSYKYENDEYDECIIDVDDIGRLIDNGLLISSELALEAMILKNKEKTYESLDFIKQEIGKTKGDIDYIFANSWWLNKFEF